MNLKNKVYETLKDEPGTRDSDIYLTHRIWQRYHGVGKSIELSEMYELPREDNVKRIRAKFQNESRIFPPTKWEVAERRGYLENEWRDLLGYNRRGQVGQEAAIINKELDTLFEMPPYREVGQ